MKKLAVIGCVSALIGTTAIVFSQIYKFTRREFVDNKNLKEVGHIELVFEDFQTRNIVLFCGVALLLAGIGCIGLNYSKIMRECDIN